MPLSGLEGGERTADCPLPFTFLPAHGQVVVDGVGGHAAGAHGQNHGGGAGDDVAAGS